MPETGLGLYWSTMHSSVAWKLRQQRPITAAGTSLQKAIEEILAYFWAHVSAETTGGVAIMQKVKQQGPDGSRTEWIAIEDRVLQDAVAQNSGIFCTELQRLGYELFARTLPENGYYNQGFIQSYLKSSHGYSFHDNLMLDTSRE